jgi:hypothetical protein
MTFGRLVVQIFPGINKACSQLAHALDRIETNSLQTRQPKQTKMKTVHVFTLAAAAIVSSAAQAAITSIGQFADPITSLDPLLPRVEPTPLGDEAFAYVDRTHELTAARVDPATGLLATAATATLMPFPSYLIGLEYVANANDNRSAGTAGNANSYILSYTVDQPSIAYLLLDNRLDGTAGNVSSPNTDDPNLGGSLAWVTQEGWTRVNTGFMPNGQADYVGIDEGGAVAGPDARTHHDLGAGVGLNQFFAVYSKPVSGSFETKSIRMASGTGNMYVVAVAPIPEPTSWALFGLGLGVFGFALRKV